MIILRLIGGLGNQLFIYAFGRALELNFGFDVYFDNYTGFKRDNYKRRFELDNFNVKIKRASLYESLFYPISKRSRIIKNILYLDSILIDENDNFSIETLKEINKKYNRIYLQGYFQKAEYFENIKEELKKEIALTKSLSENSRDYLDKIKNSNSVAVHIRLQERAQLNHFSFFPENIERLKHELTNPVFFVFSDNINYCKANLVSDSSFYFVENTSSHIEDFWLMKNCNHFITSISTFSWWATFLGNTSESKIIRFF